MDSFQVYQVPVVWTSSSALLLTMADTTIAKLLHQQFEAHQHDESTHFHSTMARAASIKKQISMVALQGGVSDLSLGKKTNNPSAGDDVLTGILLQYVDAIIAMEVSNDTREPVERAMDLVSALAAISSEGTALAVAVRAIEFSTSLLERVRAQACRLMGFLALHLSERKEEWAIEWFEALQESITPRLTDKSQSVRNSAIRSTANFFVHSNDTTEDFVEVLLWNLWHDPSVANRVAAVDSVPINATTVDHIIARVRDEKEKVRVQALEVLRNKVDPLSHLTPEHYTEVVRCGLSVR